MDRALETWVHKQDSSVEYGIIPREHEYEIYENDKYIGSVLKEEWHENYYKKEEQV